MCKRIYLNKGKFTLVSDEDFERVSKHCWTYDTNGYVVRKVVVLTEDGQVKQKKILLHREILNAPPSLDVDHRNRLKLDNRRCNIRIATRSQNSANRASKAGSSSRFKGVGWHKGDRAWQSSITINCKRKYIGMFRDEVEAAKAYDREAFKAWGEFAHLNFEELRSTYSAALALAIHANKPVPSVLSHHRRTT